MSDEGHSIKDAMKSRSGTASVPKAMTNKVTTSRSIETELWKAAKKDSIHKTKQIKKNRLRTVSKIFSKIFIKIDCKLSYTRLTYCIMDTAAGLPACLRLINMYNPVFVFG